MYRESGDVYFSAYRRPFNSGTWQRIFMHLLWKSFVKMFKDRNNSELLLNKLSSLMKSNVYKVWLKVMIKLLFSGLSTLTLTFRFIATWTWLLHRHPAKVWSVTSFPARPLPAKSLPRTWREDWWRRVGDFKRTWNGGKSSKSISKQRRSNDEKQPNVLKNILSEEMPERLFKWKWLAGLFWNLCWYKKLLKDFERKFVEKKIIDLQMQNSKWMKVFKTAES